MTEKKLTKTLTVDAALQIVRTGSFEGIKGTVEDNQIEFKGPPYQLTNDGARCELAKDVSALANGAGGVILMGFRTVKDETSAVEYVEEIRPFSTNLLDTDQYRKVMYAWIYPNIASVAIEFFPSSSDPDKGVAAIIVPITANRERPYLVTRTVDVDGKTKGRQFGYYERIQDTIPEISAESLRNYLKDGMRFAEITSRLDTIEAFLGQTQSATPSEPPDLEISSRIFKAEEAVDRKSRPNIILAAATTSTCTFPELFASRSAEIVELIENPPVLRPDGFAITPSNRNHLYSEIIEGKSRRLLAKGNRLIQLWQDGLLVTVGPGDDDMLCWFTRHPTKSKPGLPIRNFVLTEVTLNFCVLALKVFKNADPAPKDLRFVLQLHNMTEESIPCTLSNSDDSGYVVGWGPGANAPSSTIECEITIPSDVDAGEIVYRLLGQLYARFGFNFDQMPYIDKTSATKRITPTSLFPNLTT